MGGYAGFVWPAYGICAAVLGGLAAYCWHCHRRSAEMLAKLQRRAGE
ncbi:MAG: heme exporter protein CcmD [Acidobacteria bacterium]|nr:heme exporter protein CcmD [Acidobacteriota bacterium]